MLDALKSKDWNDTRRKVWLLLLMAGTAYAQTDPRFAPLVPVLTGMAGVSQPPSAAGLAAVGKVLVAGAALGWTARLLA